MSFFCPQAILLVQKHLIYQQQGLPAFAAVPVGQGGQGLGNDLQVGHLPGFEAGLDEFDEGLFRFLRLGQAQGAEQFQVVGAGAAPYFQGFRRKDVVFRFDQGVEGDRRQVHRLFEFGDQLQGGS